MTRKQIREVNRYAKSVAYAAAGLNGKRAVARRIRQIKDGRLRASSVLVSWDDVMRAGVEARIPFPRTRAELDAIYDRLDASTAMGVAP